MDKLTIPLSAIQDKGLPIDIRAFEEDLRPEGAKAMSVTEVRITGILSRADDDYVFHGDLTGAYVRPCDRCLERAEVPFSVDAVWVFSKDALSAVEKLSEEAGDRVGVEDSTLPVAIEGDEIHLRPLIWEEIALAAPLKYLCEEECAGLCPRCGANLNREECQCPAEEAERTGGNEQLAKLKDLFPDLKNKSSEE